MKITKAECRGQPSANNAFLGAQFKLDEVIKQLQFIRQNMADCKHWAHAEGTVRTVNELVEIVNGGGLITT